VDEGETAEAAAWRELGEETGVQAPDALVEVGTFDAPGRDPRGDYVTKAFVVLLPVGIEPVAADDAAAAEWVDVEGVLSGARRTGFDHLSIIEAAVAKVPSFRRYL
uniref:NUDIX domain-containing protein n=1 Tax=Glycomyces sp. MUSA5-2 TaxID=2053002 RepID=UPI00300A5ACF